MEKHELILLKQALHQVKTDGSTQVGICSQVDWLLAENGSLVNRVRGYLRDVFEKWPKRSAAPYFPVPHPIRHPGTAFWLEHKWEGEYGDNRRELLEFLKQQVDLDLLRLGYMDRPRYVRLMTGDDQLTEAEIDAGWFFDGEFDGLLAHRSWEGHGADHED